MKTSTKDMVISIGFILLITGFMLANLFNPDRELSLSERRKLASPPQFSRQGLYNGRLVLDFERYSLDQFVLRDTFRSLKAYWHLYAFGQMDYNGYYLVEGSICKQEYPLNEPAVINAAAKLNEVYEKYLTEMNVYYAIIPDKNYFLPSQSGYLTLDYERMQELMVREVRHMQYVDLFGALTLADYYRTDIHWRQERIVHVAQLLLTEMKAAPDNPGEYEQVMMYPFYGSYHGPAALGLAPETLVYLTNHSLATARVYDHHLGTEHDLYEPALFTRMQGYDIFLSGPKPLISIENPASTSNRELILFRDSFGSSIAPLMLEGYAKVTLVDLRYISTRLVGEYLDFSPHQDVLFLYSIPVINNSWMLK